MALDRFSVSVCLIIMTSYYCQIGTSSSTSDVNCPCPEIPEKPLTDPPSKHCFEIGERFRYTCISGYLRKAGTSNLIECIKSETNEGRGYWTPNSSLMCIPDPRSKPTPRSSGTSTSFQKETTSTSPTEETKMTSTSLDKDSSSQSVYVKDNQSGKETVKLTTVQSSTVRSSTPDTPPDNGTISSASLTYTGPVAQMVGIGSAVVILICAMILITILLYQRRNVVPPQLSEEMEPMNKVP